MFLHRLPKILKAPLIVAAISCLFFAQAACHGVDSVNSVDGSAASVRASVDKQAPYEVGSTTLFVHDSSRPFDAVAGVDTGTRILITEIWYPVAHGDVLANSTRATYGDYAFGNRVIHHRMLTKTIFMHLDKDWMREGSTDDDIQRASDELFGRTRTSFVDLPVAKAANPFPVIVMSHGDGGSRYSMETVCENLASHGYIVVAPEHTGNSPYSMIGMDPALDPNTGDKALIDQMSFVIPLLDEHGAYGEESDRGQSYSPLRAELDAAGLVQLDLSLVQRVNDLRAVLTKLDEMNIQGRFSGVLDMSRVGLMGRSFGGATTLAGLMLESRFASGFAVVPPSLPDTRAQLPTEMLVSSLRESAILSANASLSPARLHKPTMLVSGGEDDLILAMGQQMAERTGTTMPTADNPYPLLKSAFDSAEVPAIMAIVRDTDHGSFGVAAPYWWPELKPDTFPRFFDQSSDYQLLDANIAHRIQEEMALAFFNLTLKNNLVALEMLRSNPWRKYQTRMEIRGFTASKE